jgi:ABC-2 type transport system permease protein
MSAQQANALSTEGVTATERTGLGESTAVRYSSGSGAMLAITQRELQSIFYSPIAYIVGFIFLVLAGSYFVNETLKTGSVASMRSLFEFVAGVLVFAIPVITMRSIAEEFASGSVESLMTAPVSDASVILGKFLGAMVFYLALLATTIPHWMILSSLTDPSTATILWGYVGLILAGMFFTAVGIFASSCTKHQLLSAILGVSILAVFTFVMNYGAEYLGSPALRTICAALNVFARFSDFTKGMFDTYSIVFLICGTVLFLFLATKVLESRRWR